MFYVTFKLFSVPSKPTELFFPDVDHWSAKMIWQKPRRLNGNLLGYRLIYWRSDDEQTRLVIDNLTATTQTYLVESNDKKKARTKFIDQRILFRWIFQI